MMEVHDRAEGGCIAFAGQNCIASGQLIDVARKARELMDREGAPTVLIFDAATSHLVEVDFRGTPDQVVSRLTTTLGQVPLADPVPTSDAATTDPEAPVAPGAARPPGRPKLGVVAREVTLLPRHWEWLSEQPGGASVTLRKLVEEARRSTEGEVRKRREREACFRFMTTMAGDEPGYEESLRALYAGEEERFGALTESWPPDVRDHTRRLAKPTFR
jgi:hypothetical protein